MVRQGRDPNKGKTMATALEMQETMRDKSRDELEARKQELKGGPWTDETTTEYTAIRDELNRRDSLNGREFQDETSMPDSYI